MMTRRIVSTLFLVVLLIILAVIIRLWISHQPSEERNFTVKQVIKGPDHPWYQLGDEIGFSIAGTQGKTLRLKRGVPYVFNMEKSDQQLYFTNNPEGGISKLSGRVSGTPKPFSGVRHVIFDSKSPDVLYYNSTSSKYAGGVILIA